MMPRNRPLVSEWERYRKMLDPNDQLPEETRIALQDAFYAGAATMGSLYLSGVARPPSQFPEAVAETAEYGRQRSRGKVS